MKENLAKIIEGSNQSFVVTREILQTCMDAKGNNIHALDVSKSFGLSDYFVIASGKSDRQVQGIANKVIEALEKYGIRPLAIEGMEEGQWIVIDCGDVVAHILYEPMREHFDLESLWIKAAKLDLNKHFKIKEINQERRVA